MNSISKVEPMNPVDVFALTGFQGTQLPYAGIDYKTRPTVVIYGSSGCSECEWK